jgi:hypothetical protein
LQHISQRVLAFCIFIGAFCIVQYRQKAQKFLKVLLNTCSRNTVYLPKRHNIKYNPIFLLLQQETFNKKNDLFPVLYFTKRLVFPWKCVAYMDVILQFCYGRQKLRIADLMCIRDSNVSLSFQDMLLEYFTCSTPLEWGHEVGAVGWGIALKPECLGFDSRWCNWNFSLT